MIVLVSETYWRFRTRIGRLVSVRNIREKNTNQKETSNVHCENEDEEYQNIYDRARVKCRENYAKFNW